MNRHVISAAFALALGAAAPAALAGKPCPWNDKHQPEKSKVCKGGTIRVCQDGQWVSTGAKCTAKLGELSATDPADISRLQRALRGASKS